MALSLTNFKIEQVDGGLALLPNQPLLQGCQVSSAQTETPLVAGDIVAIDGTNAKQGIITVKKAAVTDTPLGIVLTDPIKTSFAALDRVSVIPVNCYCYKTANANITAGAKLQFTADGKVAATSTAQNGYIGIALTNATAADQLIIVQVQPGMEPAAAAA